MKTFKRFYYFGPVGAVIPEEITALGEFLFGCHGREDFLARIGMVACIIYFGRDSHGRRSEILHLLEMEIKLFGVAGGSLHELLNDYEDYMRTRRITIWDRNHPRFANLRKMCADRNDTAFYRALADRLNDEELCNLMLTLINQSVSMLNKMIDLVKADFLKSGGIKEQMYAARVNYRQGSNYKK